MDTKFNTKTLVGIVLTTCSLMVSGLSNAYEIPKDFILIESGKSANLYKFRKDNYVIVADLLKGADLKHSFGYKDNQGRYQRYNVDTKAFGIYTKSFAFVNGAFFNFGGFTDNFYNSMKEDYRIISFPATPGFTKWNDTGNTRTLCIEENKKRRIAKVIHTGNAQVDYSTKCIFSLTLLSPDVDKREGKLIPRTYIGVSNDSTKVLFFISGEKTQKDMKNIVKLWGIHDDNIIMGDGSDSSAFVTMHNKFGGYRTLPHMVEIIGK